MGGWGGLPENVAAAGNLIERNDNGQATIDTWDHENRMTVALFESDADAREDLSFTEDKSVTLICRESWAAEAFVGRQNECGLYRRGVIASVLSPTLPDPHSLG